LEASVSNKEFLAARDLLLTAESYEDAKREFRWPRPLEFNWALDYFDGLPDRCAHPALIYTDDAGTVDRVSFQRLKENSNRVANFLREIGLGKGDRVMMMLHNYGELFEIFLGSMKAGCTIIPASTLLTPDDIADRIVRGKVKCVITDREFTERVDTATSALREPVTKISVRGQVKDWVDYTEVYSRPPIFRPEETFRLNDELLIYFTSGTTARPKLVLHTHGSYPIGHLTTMYWIGLKKGDLHYNISAPGWAKHAWSTVFAAWNAEATAFVYNYSGRFDPKKVLEVIEDHEVKTLCAPPTVWRLFLLEDLSKYRFSLREAVSAGEPLNPEIIERVRSTTGITVREGYGQTETTLQIGTFVGMEVKPGSMGVEAPGFMITTVSEKLEPLGPNAEGGIAIKVKPERPVGLMTGYIDPPHKNLEVFVGDWYLTGDVAYRDDDGYFWFVGRADDVFKSSDYRISPFELESDLLAHCAVAEAAVVASPERLRMYVPKAFLMLRPEVKPSRELALDVFRFVREKIAPYKRPRIIQFVPELPKTISGKIRRVELRKYEEELRRKGERAEEEYFESDFSEELRVRK